MLGAPWPGDATEAMQQAGVLDIILPDWMHSGQPMGVDVTAKSYVEGIEDSETNYELVPDPMHRLMALLVFEAGAIARTAASLKLSNLERDRLQTWVNVAGSFETKAEIRAAQYRYGHEGLLDWAMTMTANKVLAYLSQNPEVPIFPLKGEDLVKAGLKPGPVVGDLLRELENWWIEGDFAANKPALLEELESRLKAD